MPRRVKKSWNRSAVVAYSSITATLFLLSGATVWCCSRDFRTQQSQLMRHEVQRLRSHTNRTVGRIERDLESQLTTDLRQLRESPWLPDYWIREFSPEKSNARRTQDRYAAILDVNGNVVLHSNPSHVGQRLGREWYNRAIREAGFNIVETRSPALTSGRTAFDVWVPIVVNGVEVGEYHSGFDVDWFDASVIDRTEEIMRRWTIGLIALLLIVGLALTSLYYLATHSVILRRVIDRSYVERNAQISQLAAGLAHEIRNPLHAIRLNLHTFQRAQNQTSRIGGEEVARMLDQSSREIERIDRLMQALVGFATPEDAREEEMDLATEIRSVVDFIRQEMVQRNANMQLNLPPSSISIRMDPGRFRQIMLNLIHNAAEAIQPGGNIAISLASRGGIAELTVSDDGTGISDADRKRIFEPFFTTKSSGSGLGLALVKRFVEEADGEVTCESNPAGGTTFRILLKELPKPQKWSQRR